MAFAKLSAVLVLAAVLALSSSPLALAWEKAETECGSCQKGTPPASRGLPLPLVTVPSVPLPSVPLPSVPLPPVAVPSVPLPPLPDLPVPIPPIIGGSPPKTPGGGRRARRLRRPRPRRPRRPRTSAPSTR